jgi:enoyl-CoA hydratase/carnithine racemase
MISTTRDGAVTIIRLARSDKRNALTPAMSDALLAAINQTSLDATTNALVVSGEGDMFCAGFDLTLCKDDTTVLPALLRSLSAVVAAMRTSDKPVVISAHGGAIAGGCAMLSGADIVVTTTDAKLGYPVLRLGISPAVSAPTLRKAIGDGAARARLLDTGLISGTRAVEIGLAHEACPSRDTCEARAIAIAHELAAKPAHAMAHTKRWINQIDGSTEIATIEAGLAVSLGLTTGEEQAAMLPAAWAKRG